MLQKRIKNFGELGTFLSQFTTLGYKPTSEAKNNSFFFDEFSQLIETANHTNRWFTKGNVLFAIESWANALTENNLNKWLSVYDFSNVQPKNIGLVLAGNIPLVGFHDFLCVLISGHKVVVKTSTNDKILIQFLAKYLQNIDDYYTDKIIFTEDKLTGFDAVIATGSNNTARYFEYYFRDKPSIIRKNRNSIAILSGNETLEELQLLGKDIFTYFGLGCRNVSKLFVPKNYDFKLFFEAIYAFKDVIFYDKYANNYDYNKAVYLMSLYQILDNEFLLLKEDSSLSSPIATLFYEYYDDIQELKDVISQNSENIQCVVSNFLPNTEAFGKAQQPELWDYADNIDTLKWLIVVS